jgi:hypothetical protein
VILEMPKLKWFYVGCPNVSSDVKVGCMRDKSAKKCCQPCNGKQGELFGLLPTTSSVSSNRCSCINGNKNPRSNSQVLLLIMLYPTIPLLANLKLVQQSK